MKIGIVGDLILSDHLKIDTKLLDILQSTDLNIANLEAPFIRQGMKPVLSAGLHQLSTDCNMLHQLNIKAVSLANNHMCDFGTEGIRITREMLSDQGIAHFGAGAYLEEALCPAEISINGRTLAIWGFMQKYASGRHFATSGSGGVAELRKNLVMPALKDSLADIKILYNHWNQEFEKYPEPVNKLLAEEAALYCNLLIGSHSHCLQGIQSKGQSTILYGMGNFSMPALDYAGTTLIEYPEISRDSMIVVLNLDEANPGYNIHPIHVDRSGCQISDPPKEGAKRVHSHLQIISEALQKDYASYRKFYKANKQRKLLPTQVRNQRINRLRLWLYYRADRLVRYSEKNIASLLNRAGLLSFVKRRMTRLLDYIHSNR
jgi:poly-gamma-glutamate capsule biosynthesis protein CapA/YwtB (metallophosphatase superfamily)